MVAQKVVAPPVIWQHDIFTVYIVSSFQQINGVLASIPTHYRSNAELSVCNFFCLTYCGHNSNWYLFSALLGKTWDDIMWSPLTDPKINDAMLCVLAEV